VYQHNYYKRNRSNAKKTRIFKKILLSLFAIIFIFFTIFAIDLLIYNKNIYPNIIALQQDIGGLEIAEAETVLTPIAQKVLSNTVIIENNSYRKSIIPKQDLGASIDLAGMLERAYSIGRHSSILQRVRERISLLRKTRRIPDKNYLYFNQEAFTNFVANLKSTIEQSQRDAFLEENRIISAQTGIKIKIEELPEEIKAQIVDSTNTDSTVNVSLPVTYLQPEITTNELLAQIGINQKISSFETSLQDKEENTLFNIKKASNEINGLILKPGENFLFNQIVGPAEKNDGYKESTIISNGQFTSGYGGGICQVSTTIYNAALLANLQIIERYNHSIYGDATSYVPLGRDAAIFYGYKDLKFKNSLDQAISIFCEVKGDSLIATIYGEKELNKDIKIITMDKKVHDFDTIEVERGNIAYREGTVLQEGVPGYSIKSYRVVNDANGESMEFLANDNYISVPKKIVIY
jgi:vancomycin resistance protein VanW